MLDPLLAFIRGTIAYLTLLVLTRLMGKRQVSQLTFFDYIVGITIGSIAGTLTTDLKVEPSVHWVGLLTWTLWTMVLGVVCVRSRRSEGSWTASRPWSSRTAKSSKLIWNEWGTPWTTCACNCARTGSSTWPRWS